MSSPEHNHHHHADHQSAVNAQALNGLAFSATVHCLTGCAIGEVLGMVLATALGWDNTATVVASVLLAFAFGYGLTSWPLLRRGIPWRKAASLALASDTLSIATMEIVDTAVLLLVPGAMEAALHSVLFWASLAGSLAIAGAAAYPVNRFLLARGQGHALVHAYHHH